MAKSFGHYLRANRAAWEAAAAHHRAHPQYGELLAGFARPDFSCLDAVATARLNELGLAGKAVAQLCCNNGRELLSVKNLGAGRCVGFDHAGSFLAQARELAAVARLDCTFVECDAYDIPSDFDRSFDLVLITIGVFGWMPDLHGFFRVAGRLLKPGGTLFVYEEHPILNMFEPDDPTRAVYSYFANEPYAEDASLDYWGDSAYPAPPSYWFTHTLSAVVTACLEAGLRLESFREYPHNISEAAKGVFEGQAAQLPLSYHLIAREAAP